MVFTTPLALVLFITIPIVLYIGWPRQRFRRSRDITSMMIRVVIVMLLVFSLAGAQAVQSAEKLAVIFLIDASDSVGTVGVDQALNQVRVATDAMNTDDLAGLVVFGGDAQVERGLGASLELGVTLRANPNTGNTDIAEAIRLALAMFPADAARRIVILSDGIQTLGNAEAAAQLAAAANVEISYVPLERNPEPEVRVTEVNAPSSVQEGQQFDLTINIESDLDTPARVVVFAGGEEIYREQTQLQRGANNRTLTLTALETGFRDFQVVVEPEQGDVFYQNNTLATFSQVIGPSRVLLVGSSPEDTRYLTPALREAGLIVDEITINSLPTGVAGLAQYKSVILVNVPATQLSLRRMEAIETYVRDLGGGLVVVGGPQTYGPGGYFNTPLEAALPVEMQIKDQQRLPQLTIAYVIDRSGSMGAISPSGVPMIELAKEAINRSVALLLPRDRAGIASFDASAFWVARFQNVNDQQELRRIVGTLRPSGGTDILAGMRLVETDIVNEAAEIKHIILLTDGLADATGLVELTSRLFTDHGVTTTTIAIGAPSQLLADMARGGGGNYHIANDVSAIPTIFSQETVLATRSYIFEDPFTPVLTARNPILDGINQMPALLGYIGVTPKTASQVILRAPNEFNDPILASWQYGLGRSVAFMSDATARWGTNWVSWADFSRFWSQAVRWTITEGGDNTVEMRVVMENEQARIIVDAVDSDGSFLNGLDLQASIVDPRFENQRITLRQVAPGRYEAVFTPGEEGAYLVRIAGAGGSVEQPITVSQTSGWVMSYSPEYLMSATSESILPVLAEITQGGSMAQDITAAFDRTMVVQGALAPLTPLLMLIALLMLPLDIAVRRLIITQSDLQRLRAYIGGKLYRPQSLGTPTERLGSLLEVRDRARQRAQTETDAPIPSGTIGALRARKAETQTTQAPVQTVTPPSEAKPRYTPPSVPSDEAAAKPGNIGAKLLQKRKDRDQTE